jgi:hypothetical protein
MTTAEVEMLHANVDLSLRLAFGDGGIVTAKIVSISDEEQDVIYDVMASNRPDKYPDGFAKSAYLAHFEEISRVEQIENCI